MKISFLKQLFKSDALVAAQSYRSSPLDFSKKTLDARVDEIFQQRYQDKWFASARKRAIKSALKQVMREEFTSKIARLVIDKHLPAAKINEQALQLVKQDEYQALSLDVIENALKHKDLLAKDLTTKSNSSKTRQIR